MKNLSRKVLLFLALCLSLFPALAAEQASDSRELKEAGFDYGLHIVSYPALHNEMSGLSLEDGKPIPVKGKTLEMAFDLYNRPDNVFGCVFRIITDKGENVDLMYTADLRDERKPILVTGDQVHFIASEIPMEEWIHVAIRLNTKDGTIDMDYNGTHFSVRDAGTKGAETFRIDFGLCQLTGFTLLDVASVNVRDITLTLNGKLFRSWECARHAGNLCYDQVRGVPARALNPLWMIDRYISFQPVFSHSFDDVPSITFDDRDKFYLTSPGEPIHVFSTLGGQVSEIPVRGGQNPANFPNQLFYVGGDHHWLTAYNLDEGLFSMFNFQTGRWENDKVPERDHSYWNNTNTWEPRIHALSKSAGYPMIVCS